VVLSLISTVGHRTICLMGRAPNSGAPQRVSAHVVPKAQAFSEDEEKTTIESGWEEEASTTVNQDDVADKLRALAVETPLRANGARVNTNITSTNGGALEEPTIDDQRAHAALSLITPSVAPARVVVTAGNDKGQELEIRPGKTYTIGRAIDNDFVLTDIAVSRKHFDLRYENGTWVVVDRGSGNGTVVNGNIEDQPFVLMNGDAIEIGNTTFRFDHANQPARDARPSRTLDLDDEPSTVAGKPLRDDIPSPPMAMGSMPPPMRPKTVPPPPRPRTQSIGNVPAGYPQNGRAAPPVPSAAPIGQPIPSMHGGPLGVPMASPTAPTVQPMQHMQALRPQMLGDMQGMQPMPGMMPTTIPGQGPPMAPSQPQVPAFSYPNVGDMNAQIGHLHIPNGTPRDATSTALVQPTPYGMAGMHPAAYGGLAQPRPQLFTKRVKLLIGGALLMVLAAIATIAIIKGSSSSKKSAVAPGDAKTEPTKPVVTELPKDEKKLDLQKKLDEQAALDAQKKAEDLKKGEDLKNGDLQTKLDAQKKADEQRKLDEQKKAEEQKKADLQAKLDAQKKADEQKKLEDLKLDAQKKADLQAKRVEDQKRADERRADEQRKADEARERKAEQQRKADEAREKKIEAQRKADEARKKKLEQAAQNKKDTTPVASSGGGSTTKKAADTSEVKAKADTLYRARKFKEAGQTLRGAAASLGEADARELKSTAAAYEQVGSAYNIGMGPATPAVEAYASLTKAMNLDRPFGVFTDELKGKLATVAPKAATKFMADKQYEQAFTALRVAEANGGGNGTTQAIRGALVDAANDLYQQAMSEKDSNKDGARQKLQRIRGMVDGKASVLVKAEQALRSLPK
jgi:hypothetical protein